MSLSYWNALCENVSRIIPRSAKRRMQPRRSWVSGAEHLEERALLSAVMHHGSHAETAQIAASQKSQDNSYPNLTGTWNIVSSIGAVHTGSVTFTVVSPEELTGTITIPNAPPTPINIEKSKNKVELKTSPPEGGNLDAHGKFNKQHDTVTFRTTTEDEGGKRQRVTAVVTFNSNSNPTSFTVTVTGKKKAVLETVTGTKVVP